MNKNEFINMVSEKSNFTKKDSKIAVEVVLEIIAETLAKGDSVSFIGFGTFAVADRAARIAKVPSTGQSVEVPATKVVKFKVGSDLKKSILKD